MATHTSQDRIFEHFSRFGSVQDCILMIDRITGRSRCFGFVTMKDSASVDIILSGDHIIDSKKVDFKPAVPRESPRTNKMFVGGLSTDIMKKHLETSSDIWAGRR